MWNKGLMYVQKNMGKAPTGVLTPFTSGFQSVHILLNTPSWANSLAFLSVFL